MDKIIKKHLTTSQQKTIISIAALVVVIIIAYFLFSLSQSIDSLKNNVASSTNLLSQRIQKLEADLATTTQINNDLSNKIANQENQSNSIQQTLGDIASNVNTLQKLSQTDKELLQKYSKVYFLNENFVPMSLINIDPKYLQDKTKTAQFHTLALKYLTRMIDDANVDNTSIQIVSAYRSFGTQSSLKANYTTTYGSGANRFSADQGYSEHQLGTAVDLGTTEITPSLTIKFDTTKSFSWLTNNAYRYGFVLSYPKNNSYYEYEPWHWRYIGIGLATFLHNQNKNFYDLDQRVIDTYLPTIFD